MTRSTIKNTIRALAFSILTASLSHAGVIDGGGIGGGLKQYVSCSGRSSSGDKIAFEIHDTAIVGMKQGVLSWTSRKARNKNNAVSFSCQNLDQPKYEEAPTAETNLWECSETRAEDETTEGLKKARVYRSGLTGTVNADITIEQIYSLQPISIGSLFCKENRK